jgi:hypothetical protein
MASQLILPDGVRPSNLHLNPDTDKVRFVSSDMYQIADRIREISDRLYLVELQRESSEGSKFGYALMERCQDGVDRLVMRVAADALDARVLDRLRYMMALDLHERIAICDRDREKWEREQQEHAAEELFERLGAPMHRQLAHDGFIETHPQSIRPLNRTARRHGRRMA